MSKNNLWVERYRPRLADDYVFTDDNLRQQVNHWIKDQSFPHLLLHGPAGTGKTTLAKILIHNVGIDDIDVMYTNGSKEGRYINWVDKLIGFVQTMPFGPFKVVLVDEADYLSHNAQAILRGLMETYQSQARFILTANLSHKIISPLKSRCQQIIIDRADQTEFTSRAATVLINEGIDFELDILDNYVKATYPDLRSCLKLLQTNSISGKLIMSATSSGSGSADHKLEFVNLFKKGKVTEARTLLCTHTTPEEMEELFTWMYQNLDLWSETPEGQDEAIKIIRKGLVNAPIVADPEINLSATLVELSQI